METNPSNSTQTESIPFGRRSSGTPVAVCETKFNFNFKLSPTIFYFFWSALSQQSENHCLQIVTCVCYAIEAKKVTLNASTSFVVLLYLCSVPHACTRSERLGVGIRYHCNSLFNRKVSHVS